ncbi:MAG: sigma-54-dependent Fis family transcriptional regulator [Lentisphaeria bacterium]|nr:sigma-54-dependent Fis family transcriptional regulator [Lentisphaeria bacterium]
MAEKYKILIVDDEAPTREALLRYLRRNFQVKGASDGAEAIEYIRSEEFDLVLTDLRMPRADGMSVLEAVQGKTPPPLCILLTAYGSISDAVKAVKAGAFDFVAKPIKLEKLDEVISQALSSRTPRQTVAADAPKAEATVLSAPMAKVMELAATVAPSKSTVLLTGESGTGKEVMARRIHDLSGRSGLFVPVHCAALNANLLESELFGHEKGAFTGAESRQRGRFEIAAGGTVFLDEIGEIDAQTQVKLLRVIESRSFERVGGTEPIKTDARLIAATNRDLRKMVAEGSFREDLFYRLSVVNLQLPPLRERREEIPGLAEHFLKEFAAENNRDIKGFTPELMAMLVQAPWTGNIRELRNTIEFMTVTSGSAELGIENLPPDFQTAAVSAGGPSAGSPLSLEENNFELIKQALKQCNGNRTAAAKLLGISRRTLHRRLAEMELE